MVKSLTAENRADLEKLGYTAFTDVFTSDEMDAVAGLVEEQQRAHAESLVAVGGSAGISRANEITFTDHLAENDPRLLNFMKRPEFVALLTELLGSDVNLYWNQAVYKSPGSTKEFPWHQDDGYMPVTPAPYVTLWIALDDVTEDMGCCWMLPGSHKAGLVPHQDTPQGKACYPLDVPYQGVPVPLRKGSMAVFWSMTMHKSGLNTSDRMRKGLVLQYSKAGLKYLHNMEPVVDQTPVARDGMVV